jgi:hypothetical protein
MICLPCCFGPVVRQHIMLGAHGRGDWAHGNQEAKYREGGDSSPVAPSRTCPSVQNSSQWALPLKVPPPSSSTLGWTPSLQHMGLWGTFKIQTIVWCLWKNSFEPIISFIEMYCTENLAHVQISYRNINLHIMWNCQKL